MSAVRGRASAGALHRGQVFLPLARSCCVCCSTSSIPGFFNLEVKDGHNTSSLVDILRNSAPTVILVGMTSSRDGDRLSMARSWPSRRPSRASSTRGCGVTPGDITAEIGDRPQLRARAARDRRAAARRPRCGVWNSVWCHTSDPADGGDAGLDDRGRGIAQLPRQTRQIIVIFNDAFASLSRFIVLPVSFYVVVGVFVVAGC
jgi:simple sugar transport system permease protein